MDHQGQRSARIQRTKVDNIANPKFYKPVSQRNNIFYRMKRNSAVLSRINNDEHKELLTHRSQILNQELHEIQKTQRSEVGSQQMKSLKRHQSFSLSLKRKSNKSLIISPTLPEIRQSKQILLPSPKNNQVLKQKRVKQQNQIQGTRIGVLSSKQILKKYEKKKLKEELDKKQFLDNYIKNIKMQDYNSDDDSENQEHEKKKSKKLILGKSQILKRYELPQKKQIDLSQSQQKLAQLLGNRLTDRDFIDFNVKLFEKRDINRKKYFQRYHNILKKQRQQIS